MKKVLALVVAAAMSLSTCVFAAEQAPAAGSKAPQTTSVQHKAMKKHSKKAPEQKAQAAKKHHKKAPEQKAQAAKKHHKKAAPKKQATQNNAA